MAFMTLSLAMRPAMYSRVTLSVDGKTRWRFFEDRTATGRLFQAWDRGFRISHTIPKRAIVPTGHDQIPAKTL
jgi:hypothetical protein